MKVKELIILLQGLSDQEMEICYTDGEDGDQAITQLRIEDCCVVQVEGWYSEFKNRWIDPVFREGKMVKIQ